MWCKCSATIKSLVESGKVTFKGNYYLTADEITLENYPLKGEWNGWEIEIKSGTWMQITGSIHKYWNSQNGHYGNANDFRYFELAAAIILFSSNIGIDPFLLTIHNLEFGVNLDIVESPSRVLEQVICHKNRLPLRPYCNDEIYFLEFAYEDFYFKIYDKSSQTKQPFWLKEAQKHELEVREIGNRLRVEMKVVNSGFYHREIRTLSDLLSPDKLVVLGGIFDKILSNLVFDDEIKISELSTADAKVYNLMSNPRKWYIQRKKTSADRARESRFKDIVSKYGKYKYQIAISSLAHKKWTDLLQHTPNESNAIIEFTQQPKSLFCFFPHLVYMGNYSTDKRTLRRCKSCKRDITNQRTISKFCSEKYVGIKAAQKCRNMARRTSRNLLKNCILMPLIPTRSENEKGKAVRAFSPLVTNVNLMIGKLRIRGAPT